MTNLPRYRRLTDSELSYIIKDASEAAAAMRSIGNVVAENKYLDQINDATTVFAERVRQKARRQPRSPRTVWVIEGIVSGEWYVICKTQAAADKWISKNPALATRVRAIEIELQVEE